MKSLFSLSLLLLVFACKPISVSTSVNSNEPATEYDTFYWMPGIENQVQELDNYINKDIMIKIEAKLAKEMILKGYRMDKDNPMVLVNIEIIGSEKRTPLRAINEGYEYWRAYQPQEYPAGSLVIELIHTGKEKVFWQGVAEDFLHEKPVRNNRRVEEAVHLVFENYQNKIFL